MSAISCFSGLNARTEQAIAGEKKKTKIKNKLEKGVLFFSCFLSFFLLLFLLRATFFFLAWFGCCYWKKLFICRNNPNFIYCVCSTFSVAKCYPKKEVICYSMCVMYLNSWILCVRSQSQRKNGNWQQKKGKYVSIRLKFTLLFF